MYINKKELYEYIKTLLFLTAREAQAHLNKRYPCAGLKVTVDRDGCCLVSKGGEMIAILGHPRDRKYRRHLR